MATRKNTSVVVQPVVDRSPPTGRNDAPPPPNFAARHPSIGFIQAKWDLMDDCLAGESAVKAKREMYLPIPRTDDDPTENAKRYASYIQRAVFYNATRRTLDGLVGEVFSRTPIHTFPKQLEPLLNDADGAGVALDQQSKMCLSYIMGYGRAGLLADYPDTGGAPVTRADLESGRIKPTVILYTPQSIINWRTTKVGAKVLLSLVVIHEAYTDESDPFETTFGGQWRVLRLNNGVYHVQIWREEVDENNIRSGRIYQSYTPTKADGQPFDEIPFTFVGVINNDASIDDPPMYDMAILNIAHYRNSADYEESCFIAGQPTAWFSGLTKDWVEDVFKGRVFLGSRAAIPLPEGGLAGLLQVDPNSMPKEAMDQKERQMVALGAKLVTQANVSRTLGEAQIEESSANSILATAAKNVSSGFTKILRMANLFVNSDDASINYNLNTDFPAARLTPNDRAELVKEWQDGAITFDEMRDGLRRGGIATEENITAAAKIAANPSPVMKMAEEAAKAKASQTNPDGTKNQPGNAANGGNQGGQ